MELKDWLKEKGFRETQGLLRRDQLRGYVCVDDNSQILINGRLSMVTATKHSVQCAIDMLEPPREDLQAKICVQTEEHKEHWGALEKICVALKEIPPDLRRRNLLAAAILLNVDLDETQES